MHKPAIAPLVYSRLFPNPKATDPTSFQAHVTRNLIPEVRSETVCFYGPIDCLEAQYPGLDYNTSTHRTRLGRFPWHRRLFRALDELRLTDHEIQTLCKWEGTRWARERYEKDENVKIRDTTWDDVELAVHTRPTATKTRLPRGNEAVVEPEEMSEVEELSDDEDEEMEDSEEEGETGGEESEDELQQSVGVELNQRLIAATEARARGEEAVLDADWEQWLKEAAERGAVPEVSHLSGASSSQAQTVTEQPGYYTQMIPDIFRSNPPPHIAALAARLPPPPPFIPLTQPNAVLGSAPPAPPAGSAM